ncbi:MAG TPA: glycosyltransferase family 2 protein [Puia sp.]|jgi:GT2 family glycosyltransferase
MVLSVIIVSYQVKYFLEQCLFSVEKALKDIGESEIIVLDNHSQDGSVEYLQPRFPDVHFIASPENLGFSRANNRALQQAKGKYILFLNPDTILPEDFFRICLHKMENTPGIGAAGVRMVDGSGRYLKESRRGFPTPWVAFCKLSGLTAVFPHSRLLAGYYLGHLPEGQTHPAAVLSGACMCVPRSVLERTGIFDERFFMYAEDIDLSHRIEQQGYTNYYIADTTILHFKGESTRKNAEYIRRFYGAMLQFRRKHFIGILSQLFNGVLAVTIQIRRGFANQAEPPDPGSYDAILTESDSLTFKDIIATLTPEKTTLIHARASGSAVGSPSAGGRGIAIVV